MATIEAKHVRRQDVTQDLSGFSFPSNGYFKRNITGNTTAPSPSRLSSASHHQRSPKADYHEASIAVTVYSRKPLPGVIAIEYAV